MTGLNTYSLLIFSLAVLSACTPTQATRGNLVDEHDLTQITVGVSTKQNVLQTIGSPTTKAPFDENVWYYLGQKMEKRGFLDPDVKEEKIVVVAFDDNDIVTTAEKIDSSRLDVPRVRRKTETGGNEVTFLEQLLGNIGKFNRPDSSPGI